MSPAKEMFISTLHERGALLLFIAVIFSASYIYPRLRVRQRLKQIPLMGEELGGYYKRRNEFLRDPMRFYWEGYQRCKNKCFRVTHYEGERIVLPGAALDELWNMSEAVLNKNKAYDQRVLRQYTGLPSGNPFLVHCIRSDLTRNLKRINHHLVSEVEKTVDEVIGPCEEWTSHPIYRTSLRIVAIVSGSVYVGPDRREEVQAGRASYDDMLAWMMAKQGEWKQTDDDVAGSMVQLGVASTHNTSSTIAQTLFQLAIRPELVEELREEAQRVCDQFDGQLSPVALHELKLLDSVMKEAQRLNPTTPSHFHRVVERDITLKDGTLIPQGITVEAIFAPPLFDPVLFPNPQEFDPYRFLKLRRGETPDPNHYKNKEQYTFSHATKENLAWGYGAHVCPGRYFANNEIKLILARMLLRYDIRMPGGVKEVMKPQRGGMGWTPDLRKPIEFRAIRR
ncbi:Cytochrome P450 monooxygenase ATR2 [Colletotrichum sp. SAR 10_99]|nr:Cytochrome P450 monooxygenase ATR2 [Colletotrichum sp. SAR 10_96]KAI8267703.1 Cytochrome P450 monooxygenase ATR2 [Colletotrichum sp. SAR11_239]KAI8277476.1 Cytochrome P450 monooxygenase ATR2 [Colletotrichum sp. SAR 10_98]KAJ5010632.1 Cytochrome P450 monooxygenase ATR2 [Colletotrichum sp. SAR 10_99]